MMTLISSYLRQGRHTLRRISLDPRLQLWAKRTAQLLSGFVLGAASLGNRPQPLALALVMSTGGASAVMTALGAALGYLLFWGRAGYGAIFWLVPGLLCAMILGSKKTIPLLLPSLGALIVSATGLGLQLTGGNAPGVPMYLMQVGLGFGAVALFCVVRQRRDPIADWLAAGCAVLGLAQIAPVSWLNLGFAAAGVLGAGGAFPVAALAGLALDLAQVTKAPMGAVMCVAYFLRLIPWGKRWMSNLAPAMGFVLVAMLTGVRGYTPLPALMLGGILGMLLPEQSPVSHRRGETGIAQVRLELAAGVLAQTEQLLLEVREAPIDEQALMMRTAERACGGCPCRKGCKDREHVADISAQELHRTLLTYRDLPFSCRKTGRVVAELQRSQEQLRSLRAGRERLGEYRGAVVQQYQFLSSYLQELSDRMGSRNREPKIRFRVQVNVYSNRPEEDNGDRCAWFAGTEGRYYVALCDGMGTGLGAVSEGSTAVRMLKSMLCAGFPAAYALRSVNSLCALRGQAGAVTMDLAEVHLDSGRVTVYKWGAAPSYLINTVGAEKIGTAGPPPGLSVTEARETVEQLSLRRGEVLVLTSDGAGGEGILRGMTTAAQPGEIGRRLVAGTGEDQTDDATAVLIRLTSP